MCPCWQMPERCSEEISLRDQPVHKGQKEIATPFLYHDPESSKLGWLLQHLGAWKPKPFLNNSPSFHPPQPQPVLALKKQDAFPWKAIVVFYNSFSFYTLSPPHKAITVWGSDKGYQCGIGGGGRRRFLFVFVLFCLFSC